MDVRRFDAHTDVQSLANTPEKLFMILFNNMVIVINGRIRYGFMHTDTLICTGSLVKTVTE